MGAMTGPYYSSEGSATNVRESRRIRRSHIQACQPARISEARRRCRRDHRFGSGARRRRRGLRRNRRDYQYHCSGHVDHDRRDGDHRGGGATTTVAAAAEEGRVIKIGVVSPLTGSLASFAKPDEWIVNTVAATVKDGVVCGDGKLHKFEFKIVDSQSRADRAAQVAGDLILNDKVDMVLASSNPDTVNPVADQCEVNGVPFLANFVPYEAFFFGRRGTPDKPFKWTYMSHYGYAASSKLRVSTWDQIPTNKKVGVILPNDTSGRAFANEKTGVPFHMTDTGYKLIIPGFHETNAEDFTQQIFAFKKAGCEILTGCAAASDVHQLLEAVPAAGIQPQDRHHEPGPALP